MAATKTKSNKTRKATTGKKEAPAQKNTVATKSAASKARARKSKQPTDAADEPTKHPAKAAGKEAPVKIDRRRTDRRRTQQPVAAERRKVNRRRQIDPTTCERDYTGDEIEFMQALDVYKRTSGRMFPTCSEILEVVRSLGYEKRPVTATSSVSGDFGEDLIEEPVAVI